MKWNVDPTFVSLLTFRSMSSLARSSSPVFFPSLTRYLGDESAALRGIGGGGAGGTPPLVPEDTIGWTPLVPDTGYYTVTMERVMVGGVAVDVNASIYNEGGAIVDSGSTDMTIPKKAFDALTKVRESERAVGRGRGEGERGRVRSPISSFSVQYAAHRSTC
jgi:hypothetical protein